MMLLIDELFMVGAGNYNYGILFRIVIMKRRFFSYMKIRFFPDYVHDGRDLIFASNKLRNDEEFILKAIKKYRYALKYASERLKNDKKFVLETVKQDGWSLIYASDEITNDKEVLSAVRNYLMSNEWCDLVLKDSCFSESVSFHCDMNECNNELWMVFKERLLKYDREKELREKLEEIKQTTSLKQTRRKI